MRLDDVICYPVVTCPITYHLLLMLSMPSHVVESPLCGQTTKGSLPISRVYRYGRLPFQEHFRQVVTGFLDTVIVFSLT